MSILTLTELSKSVLDIKIGIIYYLTQFQNYPLTGRKAAVRGYSETLTAAFRPVSGFRQIVDTSVKNPRNNESYKKNVEEYSKPDIDLQLESNI